MGLRKKPVPAEPVEPADDDDGPTFGQLVSAFAEQTRTAVAQGDPVPPALRGTFTVYVTPDEALILIVNVPDGPMAGEHRKELPKAAIRAMTAFIESGPAGALKAMLGRY